MSCKISCAENVSALRKEIKDMQKTFESSQDGQVTLTTEQYKTLIERVKALEGFYYSLCSTTFLSKGNTYKPL